MSELREQAERAGQGLDVEALISARMEQVERAEKAEAERDRLANQLLNEVPDSYIQMKARALDAENAIQRVRDQLHKPWKYDCACCTRIWEALDGERDDA